jgi:hypothetical protein
MIQKNKAEIEDFDLNFDIINQLPNKQYVSIADVEHEVDLRSNCF